MESFTRAFPADWTTLETALAILGVLVVLLGLSAILARWSLRKDQMRVQATAERIAALIAGQLASSSQEDGDRFSLKESNSIKALIAEAVSLALNAEDTQKARRSVRQLKSANSALATELFAEMAHAKLDEAERGASHQAAAALRHQGALTLPKDPQQERLTCSKRGFRSRPDQCRKSPRRRSGAVRARRSTQHGGLDGTGAGGRRPGGAR